MELIIGITGMSLILIAFLLNQIGKWNKKSFIYDFVNFLGSGLLCVYAFLINSWPFLILNLVWAVYSLKDVLFRGPAGRQAQEGTIRH